MVVKEFNDLLRNLYREDKLEERCRLFYKFVNENEFTLEEFNILLSLCNQEEVDIKIKQNTEKNIIMEWWNDLPDGDGRDIQTVNKSKLCEKYYNITWRFLDYNNIKIIYNSEFRNLSYRSKVMLWWHKLPDKYSIYNKHKTKIEYSLKYFNRDWMFLTGREIEIIYKAEN